MQQPFNTVSMTKKILFAAGDVGGARALIPVIRTASQRGHDALVLRHGYLARESDAQWQWAVPFNFENSALDSLLDITIPDVVIFASSVKDSAALSLARRAQMRGIKVLHVLDSWTAYLSRMQTDGKSALSPDIYAVMDTLAAEAAEAEGISRASIRITGQPSLSDNMQSYLTASETKPRQGGLKQILFVSEPIGDDQGSSDESHFFRGYTEPEVMQLLCRALQPLAEHVYLSLLPHPREDEAKLADIWQKNRGALQGTVLPKSLTATPLRPYDGIIGMASILLYEAWLFGRPTLSLQPGLQQQSLRQIGVRAGVLLVDSVEGAEAKIQDWIEALEIDSPIVIRAEAKAHAKATQNVLSLALELANTDTCD